MTQADPLIPFYSPKLFTRGCLMFCAVLFAGCPSAQPKPNAVSANASPAARPTSERDAAATQQQPTETQPAEQRLPVDKADEDKTPVDKLSEARVPGDRVPGDRVPEPPQTWSVQRIIALQATGPRIIDISVNINGRSLDEAANEATQAVIAYIETDLPPPWTWEKLLDHPLIRSGWLGNLTPEGEQRDQLINMYNRDGDDIVDEVEIAPFLSRGLARTTAFKFSNIGYAPGTILDGSPWQQLDANNDNVLDQSEIASIATRLARFDLNADHILTLAEIQSQRMAEQADMNNRSRDSLMADSTLTVTPTDKPARVASELMSKYSMLGLINRESWPDWTDAQWTNFDSNADGGLSKSELEQIVTAPPNLILKISFHQPRTGETHLYAECATAVDKSKAAPAPSELAWTSRLNSSGQASSKSFAITVFVNDSYTHANQLTQRTQLAAALNNPQLAAFIRTQLQLSENAFEVLDANQDSKLSDEEFDRVWFWLSAIRGNRVLARWMLADTPWFQVADADADGRLTELELKKFATDLPAIDRDQDKLLTPVEMPTAVRLEIARTDSRLALNAPTISPPSTVESGWFASSDTNSDGSLSSAEFLGSEDDFKAYDLDKDGLISQEEASKKVDTRVQ